MRQQSIVLYLQSSVIQSSGGDFALHCICNNLQYNNSCGKTAFYSICNRFFVIYSGDCVKRGMLIARNSRSIRVQNACLTIAFFASCRRVLQMNQSNGPIKMRIIAFYAFFHLSQSELRFRFEFLSPLRVRTHLLFKPTKIAFAEDVSVS